MLEPPRSVPAAWAPATAVCIQAHSQGEAWHAGHAKTSQDVRFSGVCPVMTR